MSVIVKLSIMKTVKNVGTVLKKRTIPFFIRLTNVFSTLNVRMGLFAHISIRQTNHALMDAGSFLGLISQLLRQLSAKEKVKNSFI